MILSAIGFWAALWMPCSEAGLRNLTFRWSRCREPEIPLVSKRLAEQKTYDAIICLGAVIRGSTPHFEYVSAEVSKGIATVGLEHGVPITFGVLTTDSLEQAIERAGTKAGNKGFEAAQAAIEMANLMTQLG